MPNVVNLNDDSFRCRNCPYSANCVLAAESGKNRAGTSARVRILHRGDHLYGEGANADMIYRVRTGSVKTRLTDTDGREQVTGFFGPGEYVGIESLHEERYINEAIALDTTSVCVISKKLLNEIASTTPNRILQIVQALGQRVREQDTMHMSLAQDAAAPRMARFLLEWSTRRIDAGYSGDEMALCMSRGDLANYLALAVETASRILTAMQRDGLVELTRTSVRLVDREGLLALAGGKRLSYSRSRSTSFRQSQA